MTDAMDKEAVRILRENMASLVGTLTDYYQAGEPDAWQEAGEKAFEELNTILAGWSDTRLQTCLHTSICMLSVLMREQFVRRARAGKQRSCTCDSPGDLGTTVEVGDWELCKRCDGVVRRLDGD